MPIQTPSATISCLISHFMRIIMFPTATPRLISLRVLFVEAKLADTSDPFRDPKDPLQPQLNDFRFENDSDHTRLVLGQLASYAAAHAGSLFRVHTFTAFTYGQSARFIRWDRATARLLPGALITSKTRILSPPSFALRMSRSSPARI